MLKKINQVLKLVGFNLVHAKKAKSKIGPARYKACVADFHNTCKSGDASAVTCIGDPPGEGRTHYEGDSCPGGHTHGTENITIGHVDAGPTQDNNITGPTS